MIFTSHNAVIVTEVMVGAPVSSISSTSSLEMPAVPTEAGISKSADTISGGVRGVPSLFTSWTEKTYLPGEISVHVKELSALTRAYLHPVIPVLLALPEGLYPCNKSLGPDFSPAYLHRLPRTGSFGW